MREILADTNREQSNDTNNGVLASVILHLALIIVFAVKAFLYPSEPIAFEQAVRVDLVALPDKIQPQELPDKPQENAKPIEPPPKVVENKPEPPPVPKVKVPPQPPPKAVVLTPAKNKQAQSDALKRLEALNRIEKQVKSDKEKAAQAKEFKPAPLKGNVITSGSSLKGLAKLDYDNYFSKLESHVKKHWNLPAWLENANLKAKVIVYFDASGVVLKKRLSQDSGNTVFNEKVLEAIEAASPFPSPPERLAAIFSAEGVEMRFPE